MNRSWPVRENPQGGKSKNEIFIRIVRFSLNILVKFGIIQTAIEMADI